VFVHDHVVLNDLLALARRTGTATSHHVRVVAISSPPPAPWFRSLCATRWQPSPYGRIGGPASAVRTPPTMWMNSASASATLRPIGRVSWSRGLYSARGEAFPRLGAGDVDAVLAVLPETGWSGWLVVEQDTLPTTPERFARATKDQRANRAFRRLRPGVAIAKRGPGSPLCNAVSAW
jgi:hypothetical protein